MRSVTPTLALQWLGAAVVAIVAIVIAVVLLRLLWTAASRQWSKYSRLENRISAIEHVLFGPQEFLNVRQLPLSVLGVSYKTSELGVYERLQDLEADAKVDDRTIEALAERVAELESYRPATIANPEDLK